MSWLELSELARQLWVAWLLLIFLGIAFYAFRPKNREHFRDCAQIPFKGERDERQDPGAGRNGA